MEGTYKRSKGNAGLEGVQFQLHLVTVCLLNALRHGGDWKISTENQEAGKYDDIVVELPNNTTLIQAKHKDNKKVTKELLLSHNSKNADFSLPKYFFSYEEIKSKFKGNTVIICTNATINNKGLEDILTLQCTDSNNMLDYEGHSSFFTCNENILPGLKLNAETYYNNNLQDKNVNDTVMADEKNFRDFLNHLQIFTNYPCGSKMDQVIHQLLSRLSCYSLYRKISAQEIYRKVGQWFLQPVAEYLTEIRARAMFAEIKSEKYCESLKECCVLFEYNDLKLSESSGLYHIRSESGHLIHMLKIHQALQDDKSKKLFVNPDEDIEVQKQSIEAFEQLHYTVLVMVSNNTTEETVLNEMDVKLKAILKGDQCKKIILVAENDNKLIQKVGFKDVIEIDGSVIFKHFSNDTQMRLLKSRNIVFQGCMVSLEELLETEQTEYYMNSLDSETLEKLIKEEQIQVGTCLLDLDEDVTVYYIRRTFKKNVGRMGGVFSEESIFEVNEKMILIVDGAGTGKSTVLTKLATAIKKERPRLWVVRVNLNDYTTILYDKQKKNIETINIIELLNSQKATKLTSNLEKLVFSMKNKIVLMLDGVDEISPNYQKLVLNLINSCQQDSNFIKIFVTTRPHLSKELQKKLKVDYFKILPFTEQDQVEFLTKYWSHHLQLDDHQKRDRCTHYAEALVEKMSSWIKLYRKRESHFAAVPLQVRMLAEIFQKNFKWRESRDWECCNEFLDRGGKQPILPDKFNITKLYDYFIEMKQEVFVDKGNPSGNISAKEALVYQFDKYFISHCSLALELMLPKEKIHLFSSCRTESKDMEECMLKIGIVQRSNDKIQFMHRSFTEYYVAASIAIELQHKNQNIEFQKFVIDEILRSVEFTVVRAFLDSSLQEIVESLPSNIFENYRSITYLQHFLRITNPLFALASEGFVAILQLILKSINFKIVRNKKIDMPRAESNYNANTLNDLEILTREAGVNIRDSTGHTPLHLAVIKGHLGMVKFLIEQGADLNIGNTIGWTALQWAARRGRVDTVKYLLECGADIKVKCSGFTPLHLAAWCEQHDTVKLLIDEGIDLNIRDDTGRTALHFAAEQGNVDVIKFLGEYGIDVNARDNTGYTALHAAATGLNKQWKCIECLVEAGVDVNIKDKTDRTVLHYAAADSVVDIVKYLLNCGADFNAQDEKGYTAIHAAAWTGCLHCVKYLVEAGADLSIKDKSGCTVLHFAAEGGNIDTVKYLLSRGVEVNVAEEHGCTALHVATWGSYFDTVKCLLEAGADVKIKNENGCTALNFAIEKDDIRSVRYLIKYGADVNVEDNRGWTPLLLSAWNGYLNILICLEQAGANIHAKSASSDTALHFAAEKGNTAIVKYLIDCGAGVNFVNKSGSTVLHMAAFGGYLDTLQYLVDAGADLNSKDEKGCTVLHFATKKGNTGAVKYLTECGVDVNIEDNRGCTALHAAAWCGYLDTVKCLVELGVNIDVRSKKGNTALSLAISNNQSETVQYLTQIGAKK